MRDTTVRIYLVGGLEAQPIQPTAPCANPEIVLLVHVQSEDTVGCETVASGETLEFSVVPAAQSRVRPEPQVAGVVFANGAHRLPVESIPGGEPIKLPVRQAP